MYEVLALEFTGAHFLGQLCSAMDISCAECVSADPASLLQRCSYLQSECSLFVALAVSEDATPFDFRVSICRSFITLSLLSRLFNVCFARNDDRIMVQACTVSV
jgi:hypothetical protein